jgi:hypothetical protein
MKARFLAGVLALAAIVATPSQSPAHFQGPFSCGTFCVCHFQRMHSNGPLYSYGPYDYGAGCNGGHCGWNWNFGHRNGCGTCGGSWRGYALSTWKNVFHRTHPCGNKIGCLGSCGCK